MSIEHCHARAPTVASDADMNMMLLRIIENLLSYIPFVDGRPV